MAVGTVIGKSFHHGFAGSYAAQPDSVIDSHALSGDRNVRFGDAVMLHDGKVTAIDADATAENFLGVATREIKSPHVADTMEGEYRPGENKIPVMKRGRVSVICQAGDPEMGGPVYLRIANPSDGVCIGGLEAEPDGADTVRLTNCVWVSGRDARGVADLRIKTINLV